VFEVIPDVYAKPTDAEPEMVVLVVDPDDSRPASCGIADDSSAYALPEQVRCARAVSGARFAYATGPRARAYDKARRLFDRIGARANFVVEAAPPEAESAVQFARDYGYHSCRAIVGATAALIGCSDSARAGFDAYFPAYMPAVVYSALQCRRIVMHIPTALFVAAHEAGQWKHRYSPIPTRTGRKWGGDYSILGKDRHFAPEDRELAVALRLYSPSLTSMERDLLYVAGLAQVVPALGDDFALAMRGSRDEPWPLTRTSIARLIDRVSSVDGRGATTRRTR